MSFWERLRRWRAADDAAEEEPAIESALPPAEQEKPLARMGDEIAALADLGAEGGPSVSEAIGALRRARGTVREAEAVTSAMRAIGRRKVADPILVACADILATRGDDEQASKLLEGTISVEGLVLAADLHAARGQLARALGSIERVLARDIDAPGARERHTRWRASLGGASPKPRRSEEATIVAASSAKGPFRLLREVARGGAGTVYEADDDVLGRRVAFKVYHRRGADSGAVEREARLAASLAGPGVIRVLDASPAEGWVALEWIARGSVRDLLKLGDWAALVPIDRWARSLAHALSRVHAAGFVHADVKPANVLLRQPGEAVLGDFGIARPIGEAGEGGSPGYLSPERIEGRPSDPRDDVYGYGRILEDVLHRLVGDGQPGALLDADAAEPWRSVALRCLGPDEARPADATALLRILP